MSTLVALLLLSASPSGTPKPVKVPEGGYVPIVQVPPPPQPVQGMAKMAAQAHAYNEDWVIETWLGAKYAFTKPAYVLYELSVQVPDGHGDWQPLDHSKYHIHGGIGPVTRIGQADTRISPEIARGKKGQVTISDSSIKTVRLHLQWVRSFDERPPVPTYDDVEVTR